MLGRAKESVNYTTAKLVLVGDSGVGKTGLGWRLAYGEFKEHASTHGQQFWTIPQFGLKRKDGTDCEAVLWDLAGQHVYRQVHSIFLENVVRHAGAVRPQQSARPAQGRAVLAGAAQGQGATAARRAGRHAGGSRCARALRNRNWSSSASATVSVAATSAPRALNGEGLDALLEIVKAQIPWDEMTATVTTVTFKRIKDYVLVLKEKTDRKGVLVSPAELRAQLETAYLTENEGPQTEEKTVLRTSSSIAPWQFTDAEMMTAVGHLETHGYVAVLRSSTGEQHILLAPDLLVNLAASFMLLADKNPQRTGRGQRDRASARQGLLR